MSSILDKYRNEVHLALVAMRDSAAQDLRNGVTFRRSVYGGSNFIPAMTCEEIAIVAVEKAARLKAIDDAIATLGDTYKRLFEKDEHDDG